jgi:hypothetical protein
MTNMAWKVKGEGGIFSSTTPKATLRRSRHSTHQDNTGCSFVDFHGGFEKTYDLTHGGIHHMTRIFALTNHKGGMGKSMSATNIALGISAMLRPS